MQKVLIVLFFLITTGVVIAGCSQSTQSNEPFIGTYTDTATGKIAFTINGDGSFVWKYPQMSIPGTWQKEDATTIRLSGGVQTGAGTISVPPTISYDPEKQTLQIGSFTYTKGSGGSAPGAAVNTEKFVSLKVYRPPHTGNIELAIIRIYGMESVQSLTCTFTGNQSPVTVTINNPKLRDTLTCTSCPPGDGITYTISCSGESNGSNYDARLERKTVA